VQNTLARNRFGKGMLDGLKKESRFEENVKQIEDKLLEFVNDKATPVIAEWTDCLSDALKNLSATERELVQWLFIEGFSLAEYAE